MESLALDQLLDGQHVEACGALECRSSSVTKVPRLVCWSRLADALGDEKGNRTRRTRELIGEIRIPAW